MDSENDSLLNVEALAALGAERLAEILHGIARDDPRQRRQLEDVLRQASPAAPPPARSNRYRLEIAA